MGTAFHAALAFITSGEPTCMQDVLDYFLSEMSMQRTQALTNYRERRLPWPSDLRETMENVLAVRYATQRSSPLEATHRAEVTLVSPDGLLVGRPDEVTTYCGSPLVIDYKTGLPKGDDMTFPEEQIHFYAGLWAEIHGIMPTTGRVEFLLGGSRHEFAVNEERSVELLSEAREMAKRLQKSQIYFTPRTGAQCEWCDYRPWCEEYWLVLSSAHTQASSDLQGFLCADHRSNTKAFCLRSAHAHVSVVNKDIEPLPEWKPGSELRYLGLAGHGDIRFRTTYSEVFQVLSNEVSYGESTSQTS